MQILVKTLNGMTITLDVEPKLTTIDNVKAKIIDSIKLRLMEEEGCFHIPDSEVPRFTIAFVEEEPETLHNLVIYFKFCFVWDRLGTYGSCHIPQTIVIVNTHLTFNNHICLKQK